MKETIGRNLTLYREGLSLSKKALAEKVGVAIESIENYENARTLPDGKTLSALARALEVTMDDLLRSPPTQLSDFRFRDRASFEQNPQFTARVRRMLETYNAIEAAVGESPFAPETLWCDRLEGNEKLIQTTADRFRRSLRLDVTNLFQAVEEVGLKVLREAKSPPGRSANAIPDFLAISACSFFRGAFVLVNTYNITRERQLFGLARELGHLIFHRDEYGDSAIAEEEKKAREKVADYFASHLLAGQKAFDFPENQRYRQLIWRALELEKISELKAAELLGFTVEQMRMSRQETEVYAIS